MKYGLRHVALWVSLYILFAVAPMLMAFVGPLPEPRTFWVEFSVGLGFVGLAIMGLQFVLTGRFGRVAASLGLDTMLQFHRQAGLVAFVFIFAHPLILFATNTAYLDFLDPRVNFLRAVALSAVMGALALLIVTTIWRQPIGLNYEWWRTAHGVLALIVMFIGLVHILQVGHYVSVWWKQALWIGMTGGAIFLLVNTRVIRPLKLRREPYRVEAVREERGESWTLVLKPDGHPGMRFLPGQFVWLTLGESPFSLQQHPFSIASSAEQPERIELTIKELGDFTLTLPDVEEGSGAFLEGPFGAFTPEPAPDTGMVFIVGGVGITPIMSILRTFRDRSDPRQCLMLYGNPEWEDVLFRDELDMLQDEINLKVVHALGDPPPDWEGETGHITTEMLDRYLPDPEKERRVYFLCGPEPMLDSIEPYLRERGVPLKDIFSERFEIV
jgi:predicted ferric reductase